MYFPSEQQITFLPLLIQDVSLEHSHRRTAVDPDGETSAIDHALDHRRGPRRRLVGFLAATALGVGLVAATVSAAPAAPPVSDFRLAPGLAQPPGYIR
jgi:hypothetical protein